MVDMGIIRCMLIFGTKIPIFERAALFSETTFIHQNSVFLQIQLQNHLLYYFFRRFT